MACPEPKSLEALVAGRLTEEQESALEQHATHCAACRSQVSFLTAIRLGLEANREPNPEPTACLQNEELAAVLDGALDPAQRSRATQHLAGCPECLAGLASLHNALAEIEQQPQAVPADLLQRAIRIGAPAGESAATVAETAQPEPAGWFERIFGAGLPWRLGLAGAAAALVLLLTVVLTSRDPGPAVETPAQPQPPDQPRVAQQPPSPTKDLPGPGPDSPTMPDSAQPPGVAEATPAPSAPATAAPTRPDERTPRTDWLAHLDADMLAGLASQARPKAALPRTGLGTALSEQAQPASFSEGYVLGRALGFLDRFGPRAGESAELRQQIAETLLSLEPAIRSVLPTGERADRLVEFANGLAQSLRSGQIDARAASRRLLVFGQAMREALEDQDSLRGGLRLGLLVQGWQTEAHAGALGVEIPLQDAAALKRARRAIRSDPGLSDPMRRSVLQDLSAIETAQRNPQAKPRAAQILGDIDRLDERIRSTR